MIHFLLLFNRQGKIRLSKYYNTYSQKDRTKLEKEITLLVLSRREKLANFLDWKEQKLVYKRYASLYFVVAIDKTDNELITLEIIHRLVTLLDKFFENVCELDIVYNFDKVYWILDELLMAGELQEPSINEVLRHVDYPEQQERAELISTFI